MFYCKGRILKEIFFFVLSMKLCYKTYLMLLKAMMITATLPHNMKTKKWTQKLLHSFAVTSSISSDLNFPQTLPEIPRGRSLIKQEDSLKEV